MMNIFKCAIFFVVMLPILTFADDYSFYKKNANDRYVELNNFRVYFGANDDSSNVYILDASGKVNKVCKINNWVKSSQPMMNVSFNVTNDRKAILIYGINSYLLSNELLECSNGSVSLHRVSDGDDTDTVVDINFGKHLYLSVRVDDAQTQMYKAKVVEFNGGENLIDYGVFFLPIKKIFNGKISLDGKYVYPDSLDCFEDSSSGVWDIKEKKKVVFTSDTNSDDEITDKCQKLFNGEATLKDLGGKLVLPDK